MSTVPILIAEDDRRNIVIDRPAIVVGRSRRRSDICIDDRSISAVHCEISIGDNCLQVRNRGRNGIRINGRKSDEGVLRDGDTLEIARLKYRVLMNGDSRHPNRSQSSSSNDWFVRLAGMELGPMPWAELSLMAQRGELTRSDEVRWSQQRNWRPAATTDGLFPANPNENPKAPATQPAAFHQPVEDPADESRTEQSDDDDQSWTGNFEALDDSEESSIHDRDQNTDTALDLLDATASSANTFRLAGTPTFDSDDMQTGAEPENEVSSNNVRRRLNHTLAAADNDSEPRQASLPSQTAPSLPPRSVPPRPVPPRPVPPPLIVAAQPAPRKPPPIPKIGRSDTMLDVIYDSVLEPVFDRVPLLKTWPGIATVVTGLVLAGLVAAALLMRPSYEGTEVSGMVTLNGQPLTDATISFTDLQSGFGASAVVGPNGKFEVVTLKGGMKPGTYNIAVMPMKPDANSQLPPSAIPFHCRSIQTSGITREITDEGPNDLLIELAATPD